MITFIISYYLIGVVVSSYFIYYYRFSNKTKGEPKKTDAIGGLIGAWVFPLQIIKHFKTKRK